MNSPSKVSWWLTPTPPPQPGNGIFSSGLDLNFMLNFESWAWTPPPPPGNWNFSSGLDLENFVLDFESWAQTPPPPPPPPHHHHPWKWKFQLRIGLRKLISWIGFWKLLMGEPLWDPIGGASFSSSVNLLGHTCANVSNRGVVGNLFVVKIPNRILQLNSG